MFDVDTRYEIFEMTVWAMKQTKKDLTYDYRSVFSSPILTKYDIILFIQTDNCAITFLFNDILRDFLKTQMII